MLTRCTTTWLDDQRKDYINPKGFKPRNCSKQLQTHNLPTDDVEHINREETHFPLTSRGLFPEDQKGCRKWSRGTAELLYVDQHILNESKTRRKNLAMAWIDYKKAHDMVPQCWIINCLKMYKISYEVVNFIEKTFMVFSMKFTTSTGELNWQQAEEAWLKQKSKEVFSKEMHHHPYYS